MALSLLMIGLPSFSMLLLLTTLSRCVSREFELRQRHAGGGIR
jgi:hypothetical protein